MARQKLSEYRAKTILYIQLELPYDGIEVTPTKPLNHNKLNGHSKWVVKVDEGVKKRGHLGLMRADITANEIADCIKEWQSLGYRYFIAEPFVDHSASSEKYLCLQRTSEGINLLYSSQGGIEIEEHKDTVNTTLFEAEHLSDLSGEIGIPEEDLSRIALMFDRYHFSFLEINPYLILDGRIIALDAAAYVDSAAGLIVAGAWSNSDFRNHSGTKSMHEEEKAVAELAVSSQASFKYDIINPNGSIFMLLSGGGASVTLADEIYNLGAGKLLANYGEYSGNPNRHETYIYTKQIIRTLLNSHGKNKILIIAGGVANFTDIRETFNGILGALSESAKEMSEKNVKIYVRRGGPHEEEALETMSNFLEFYGLLGSVNGSEEPLTSVVTRALSENILI